MRQASLLNLAAPSSALIRSCALLALCAANCVAAHAEIVVDGRLDEAEWTAALHCADWRRTAPFARDEPRYRNEVSLLSTRDRSGGGVRHRAAACRATHQTAHAARRRATHRRLRLADDRLRCDRSGRLRVLRRSRRRRTRRAHHEPEPVRSRLGRRMAARGERERRAMDRRTLHPLVDDQHARFRRRHAHDRRLCIALSPSSATSVYACPGIATDAATFLSDFARLDDCAVRRRARAGRHAVRDGHSRPDSR